MMTGQETPSLARSLAERASAIRFDDLDPAALHWAKVSILDTLGVMLAGGREESVSILSRCSLVGQGAAVRIDTGQPCDPLSAAEINGMAAHVLDFDTSNDRFSGHPTVQLLPPLLALAQDRGLSGRALIAAYVAGFEVQGRVASMIAPAHFEKGWFSTSALGGLGAAAGAARLLALDSPATTHALGSAAMMACGSVAHAGSMTKPFAAGHAARAGLLAAMLANEGFTAAPDGLAGHRGLLRLMVAAEHLTPDFELADWGRPFLIRETASGVKLYPCCGIFHSSLDVLSELRDCHVFSGADVTGIEAQLFTSRMAHIDRPDPGHDEDAKFSVQHCLAVVAAEGGLGLGDFGADRRDDPLVAGLRAKVLATMHPATDLARGKAGQGGCEITVELRDGRRLHGAAQKPRGRLPEEPVTDDQLSRKFLLCAGRRMNPAAAARLLERLWSLEAEANLVDMLPALDLGRE